MNTNPIQITIDGRQVTVDASVTILEAARQHGIDIPTLCHHPALSNWGGCRLCVVEVDQSHRLAASCVMPVRNGMQVVTVNDAITASRRMTLELLFAERNHNCMFCPESGHCELQKMAYAMQMDHLTVNQSFPAFPVDVTGEYMTIDHNRCILCGRCVRACQEIAGSHVLGFHLRGPETVIGFDLMDTREASTCINCGACLQVCPTGAISNRYRTHYAVKGQKAEQYTLHSACAACGLLCPTLATVRDNQLIRIEGILSGADGHPDRGRLCYKGRFEVLKTRAHRLRVPMVKDEQGHWQAQSWEHALYRITDRFQSARDNERFGIVSSRLSNENLMLFKTLMADQWNARVGTLDGDHLRNLKTFLAAAPGSPRGQACWQTIVDADVVLVIGADLHHSHPLLLSLLRQACIEKKIHIAVIGQSVLADLFSTDHLPVMPGDLTRTLNRLAAMVASWGKPSRTLAGDNDPQEATLSDIALAYKGANRPFILVGGQVTGAKDDSGLRELSRLALLKEEWTGQSAPVVILTPASNTIAAWRLGLCGPGALEGKHHGIGFVLIGDEPDADLDSVAERLQKTDFLAVATPYINAALAEIAHVMLPTPLCLEEDGSFMGLDWNTTVFKPRVLDPPPGIKRTWETLQALAQQSPAAATALAWADIRLKTEKTIIQPAQ
jgi:formate dehydrogenase major subunit